MALCGGRNKKTATSLSLTLTGTRTYHDVSGVVGHMECTRTRQWKVVKDGGGADADRRTRETRSRRASHFVTHIDIQHFKC